MSPSPLTPETRFAAVVDAFRDHPDVSPPADAAGSGKRFGASALKVGGKIFAMLVGGNLVVKLPRQRVDALIAAGTGTRFDPGHGRVMKEWIADEPTSAEDWLPLAQEALAFVAPQR